MGDFDGGFLTFLKGFAHPFLVQANYNCLRYTVLVLNVLLD